MSTKLVKKDSEFAEVLGIIRAGRAKAYKAVNVALIDTYWAVGAHLSSRVAEGGWGKGVVRELSDWLLRQAPDLKGFSASNLWRMKQFYDVYADQPKLAALLRVLPWTHNLMILGQNKRPEEREFYLRLAVKAKWSSRELAHQIKTAAFERTILSDKKLAALPRLLPQDASGFFKDRREPDSIGIAMPVGRDQSGAPATVQESQVRAGRRASDAKMAEPGVSLRHLD